MYFFRALFFFALFFFFLADRSFGAIFYHCG